jgi:hypothetical protein
MSRCGDGKPSPWNAKSISWPHQVAPGQARTLNGCKAAEKDQHNVYPTELNTPKVELEKRASKLQIYLQNNNIEGALILQRADLFYFTGTIQQANLYVPAHGDPVLMVRKSYDRASAESSIEKILHLDRSSDIPNILKANGHTLPAILGLELDVLPTNLFFNYQGIFENPEVVDISQAIRLIRAIKSPYEIDMMRRAAELSDQVAGWVPKILCEGMTEIELAGKIEAEARKLGHQGVVRMRLWGSEMFYGHLMSGPTGAVPSFLSSPTGGTGASPAVAQGPGFKTIQRHEPVLVMSLPTTATSRIMPVFFHWDPCRMN